MYIYLFSQANYSCQAIKINFPVVIGVYWIVKVTRLQDSSSSSTKSITFDCFTGDPQNTVPNISPQWAKLQKYLEGSFKANWANSRSYQIIDW